MKNKEPACKSNEQIIAELDKRIKEHSQLIRAIEYKSRKPNDNNDATDYCQGAIGGLVALQMFYEWLAGKKHSTDDNYIPSEYMV